MNHIKQEEEIKNFIKTQKQEMNNLYANVERVIKIRLSDAKISSQLVDSVSIQAPKKEEKA